VQRCAKCSVEVSVSCLQQVTAGVMAGRLAQVAQRW